MHYRLIVTKFFIISLLCLSPFTAYARFKCWNNSDGIRECGENVPPEYVQQGHEEINDLGITVNKQERAKTIEEIEEEKIEAEVIAQEKKIKAAQDRQDRILLETFSNVGDIEMTRDGKIASLDTAIHLTEKRNEKLQSELDVLMMHAAFQERKGQKPSDVLLKDIEYYKKQMDNNAQFIVDKRKEQVVLRETYAEDIERFKKLTHR